MTETISRRALNRAVLARQLLLARSQMPALEAVEHLVGLQAQTPQTWYAGLWARLEKFDPAGVGDLLEQKLLVRVAVMRGTIHLLTAHDALSIRPLVQPVIDRGTKSSWGKSWQGIDYEELVRVGAELVDGQSVTPLALGQALQTHWPDHDAGALAQAIRCSVPLAQTPPRGVWRKTGQASHMSLESWLGKPLAPTTLNELVMRFLGAFGPASVKDAQTWSGLTRLNTVFDQLRPELVSFKDETGRELFDLPNGPRPHEDTPAPIRFLYDFDNLMLSLSDRTHLTTGEFAGQTAPKNGQLPGSVLIDGFAAATWTVAKEKATATVTVKTLGRLTKAQRAAIEAEGQALLAFLEPEAADHQVVMS